MDFFFDVIVGILFIYIDVIIFEMLIYCVMLRDFYSGFYDFFDLFKYSF